MNSSSFQEVNFIIDSFDSEQPDTSCPNPNICNCGRDSCCAEGCECGCTLASCNCCEGSVKYDTIYIDLPKYFTSTPNPKKEVVILLVRLFDMETMNEITASLHTNLIRNSESADNYLCATNIAYPVPKKYVCSDNKEKFECWFRDLKGHIIDLDPSKRRVVIECVLRF